MKQEADRGAQNQGIEVVMIPNVSDFRCTCLKRTRLISRPAMNINSSFPNSDRKSAMGLLSYDFKSVGAEQNSAKQQPHHCG